MGAASLSHGNALDDGTREFFERRFGFDFGAVRIYSDEAAAASAGALQARAYTVGSAIVFGADEYAPASAAGQRLLAHELTHVVQQTGGGVAKPTAPLGISRVAPSIQRASPALAEKSSEENAIDATAPILCPVHCGSEQVGSIQAEPLFPQFNKQPVPAGAKALGIGAIIHFSKNKTCDCDSYDIIQVVTTNDPPQGRSATGFVDNLAKGTPFYGAAGGKSGTGIHTIPASYPGAGSQVQSEVSIYDMPSDVPPDSVAAHGPLFWRAETRVICVRNNAPDRVLDGVSWGFRRLTEMDANGTVVWKPSIEPIERQCLGPVAAGSPFVRVLSTDPSVAGYQFE
jgi:hypothetical protein